MPSPAIWTIIFAVLSMAPPAFAGDAHNCKNPAWAPATMPGFVIDSCDTKAWVSDDYDLVAGEKTLQGERSQINYTLKDESKNPTADAARDYHIAAGKKAGAALMSDPAGWGSVMVKKTPQGEYWFVYAHGTGNGQSTESYTLTTYHVMPLPQDVVAQAMKGRLDISGAACTDPPWLAKQFAYFKVDSCEAKIWDQVQVELSAGTKTLEGARTTVGYALTDKKKNPAAVVVKKNYIAALQKIGAKLMNDPGDDAAILMQNTPQGEFSGIFIARAPATAKPQNPIR